MSWDTGPTSGMQQLTAKLFDLHSHIAQVVTRGMLFRLVRAGMEATLALTLVLAIPGAAVVTLALVEAELVTTAAACE